MKNKTNQYEDIASKTFSKIYPYLLKDLKNYCTNDFENKKVLEIGTGPGFIISELLKEKFSKIYGIDISLNMLIRASSRNIDERLMLINSKAENLPLKNDSIDLIISRGSVFFWKDLSKAFREIYRVLRDNGFLLIGGGYGISTPDEIIDEILTDLKKDVKKNDKPKLNINYMVELMEKNGGKTQIITKPKHGFWISWKK